MLQTDVELNPVFQGCIPPEYAHLIGPDPHRPGLARARLIGYERPIWAIVQEIIAQGSLDDPLDAADELIAHVADDFGISTEAVRASLAYDELNRGAIDAKFAEHAAGALRARPIER